MLLCALCHLDKTLMWGCTALCVCVCVCVHSYDDLSFDDRLSDPIQWAVLQGLWEHRKALALPPAEVSVHNKQLLHDFLSS